MDEFTEKLTKIFLLVNDWLKYAEAKNAFVLAFSGAGITATITYLSAASSNTPQKSLLIGMIIATCFLCITSLICAMSFLPKTSLEGSSGLAGISTTNGNRKPLWVMVTG